jgi:hypothetical protein
MVRVLAEAERSYWDDLDATPPPHAMLRDPQLVDERGNAYSIDYQRGDPPYVDAAKSTVGFRLYAAFQGLACDAEALTFTSGLVLGGIPSEGSLSVDIQGRAPGDRWSPGASIEIAGMVIPVDELRVALISSLEDDTLVEQPALEFRVKPIEQNGVRLECLDFTWIAPEVSMMNASRSCEIDASSITSSFIGGPLAPLLGDRSLPWSQIQFRATGSIVLVNQRVLGWSFR